MSTQFQSNQLLSDEDILKLGIDKNNVEIYRRMKYQANFSIETWINELEEHTFKSKFIKLSYEEGLSLSQSENRRTEEDHRILDDLSSKIDEIIKSFPSKAAFVKLSTRSPKDVPVYDVQNKELQDLIVSEFDKIQNRTDNDDVWAFVKATTKIMKVTSGKQAMDLLSRSIRIKEDLSKIIQFGKEHFSANIVCREWLDEVADYPHMEFRGFVNNKSLNAVSQYISFAYSQELIDRKDEISKLLIDFFDSIKDKIPHTAYVIDFYIRSDNKVMIIELNPFHIGAGACLFSWRNDRERFLNGPFELRVVEKIPDNSFDMIPLKWQKWINQRYYPERLINNNSSADDEEGSSCTLI